MVTEQRNRRFWLETALIVGAWAVFGLVLANQGYMQSGRFHHEWTVRNRFRTRVRSVDANVRHGECRLDIVWFRRNK